MPFHVTPAEPPSGSSIVSPSEAASVPLPASPPMTLSVSSSGPGDIMAPDEVARASLEILTDLVTRF